KRVSQFVLDDHLDPTLVRDAIVRWSTASFLRDVRPGEVINDDRVPSILATLRTPTFITIDDGFWKLTWRGHSHSYGISYFEFRADEQRHIASLLRRLLRLPEFRTRPSRMRKAVPASRVRVPCWPTA